MILRFLSYSGQISDGIEVDITNNDFSDLENKVAELLESKVAIMTYRHFLSLIDLKHDYDPEINIPKETLERVIESFEWNNVDGEIIVDPDEDLKYRITSRNIQELVEFLDNEIIQAMNGEMPLHWLKEQEIMDYEYEVREFLIENLKTKIAELGWNIQDL